MIDWAREDYAEATPAYEAAPARTWRGDAPVEGRVWGGCLSILRWQLATNRYLPAPGDLDGTVLAIETSEQLPSADRVRWTLRAMGERGLLERFDGLLVGRPQTRRRGEDPGPSARRTYRREQRAGILAMLERYNPDATAVLDLEFGHTNPTAPIPIGGRVEVDPGAEVVRFP